MSISWTPILPLWAVGLITFALLLLLIFGTLKLARKRVPVRWLLILGALRVAIIFVFAVCMLQPVISYRGIEYEGPPVLVLLDASKSMGIKDVTAPASRLTEAMQWLKKNGLQDKLTSTNVHWFAFDGHARSIFPTDFAALSADGITTRYADSLTDAWEYCRQQRDPDATIAPGGRVLLVSDGHDFGTRDVAEVSRHIGLPVDTLSPASARAGAEAPHLSITQIQAPRRVLLGAESRFSISMRQEGLVGKSLTLQLKEGEKLVGTQPFKFSVNQNEKLVSLSFQPETAGLKEYSVEIEGAPEGDNNTTHTRKFSVQVVGSRNEVLFIEDNWRWDFKFLRRIFEDDPSFTLTAFLSRGENAFVQLTEPDRRTQVTGFPQSRGDLAAFDSVVLGSVDPRRWPRGFAMSLKELVEEEGKSLVVIGGPNLLKMMEQPALAALLPVELSRESGTPVAGPVTVHVTPEGLSSSFFAAPGDLPASFWAELPPMDQIYAPLRKKPAATVLAEATQLANPYGKLILIAEHTVGRGRVLFIATDTLWKWQMLPPATEGPTPYQVFWQQALRALAPIRLSSGNVSLNLEPDRSRYEPGQIVVLRADVQISQALPKTKVQAQVTLPDGKQLPLDFSPDPANAGIYTTRFAATITGQHKVTATVVIEDKIAADTLIAFDVEESTAELSDPHVNEANLTRIARDTGGQRINRADPATWRALENIKKVPVSRVRTLDLWNGFTLILLLSILLGIDWLLRLLRGLT